MSTALPIIVSYYTADTPYATMATRLRASCESLDLDHYIVALESLGSWEANTAAKASVCRLAWEQVGRPILWVDADAVIHQRPELLRGASADFAVHRWKGQYFASGTVFFNQTPMARQLLNRWVHRCAADLDRATLDQTHLEDAWKELILQTTFLPRSYCQIFDAPRDEPPVIEHFQASRLQQRAAS